MPSVASLLRLQFFKCIHVAKDVRRKSGPFEFVFGDYPGGCRIEQQIDSIPFGTQSRVGGVGEFASIEGTQGLPAFVPARNHSYRFGRGLRLRNQVLQKCSSDERHIHREYEVEIRRGCP